MSTSPFETRRRVEALLAEIGVQPGEQIPTEREFVTRLGLSRAGVRRTLAELQAEGKVIRHVGRGTFLIGSSAADPCHTSPSDVMVVRRLIEPATARLIVSVANQDDIAEIQRCVDRSEAATTFADFERWDGALHRAMVDATHSPLLARIYGVIDDARSESLWGVLKQRSYSAETRDSYEKDHRKIMEAIARRDADAAASSVTNHLDNVTARLLG